MSLLVGKWANPGGGETVEFTAEGTMVVSRGGEVLATQDYATRNDGAAGGAAGGFKGGELLLHADGAEAEAVLEYRIGLDVLVMGFNGETTLYTRVSGEAAGG